MAGLAAVVAAQQPTYDNPVLPGDHPDPSVVRVGNEYWATSTTSQWAPIFPLLRSTDLVTWVQVGSVFSRVPTWTDGSYWAPEISGERGRFYVYYTARKRNGPLCVAVATATRPSGPYTDHGPIVCQPDGSIDASTVLDQDGQRYLVWKEDGNSQQIPTIIWAQRLSADGTRLIGDRRELLRNDGAWEGEVVEGPFVLRRGDWFYMFYSGGACCGRACTYALGVARAKRIQGPWERDPANPILAANDRWKCPGHGTVVTTADGRTFLLYHAYDVQDFQYAGRQGLLDEVTWNENDWPEINGGRGPSGTAASPSGVAGPRSVHGFDDEFEAPLLAPTWQWPWNRRPDVSVEDGALVLRSGGRDPRNAVDSIVARPALVADYTAVTRIQLRGLSLDTLAGLAAFGDVDNALGVSINDRHVIVWRREKALQQMLASAELPAVEAVDLRMVAQGGQRYQFAYSVDGQTWLPVGSDAEGGYLPPWDEAVRVALAVSGPEGAAARFAWVRVQ